MKMDENNHNETIIEVSGLTKRFGSFTAVNNISFSIKKGEIFGFLGPNGSGKSTTIRMLCGILTPTEGSATVLGYQLSEVENIKKNMGYMSQKFSLYQDLTVAENIRFYANIYSVTGDNFTTRMQELLELADLKGKENNLTASLPGGWRQRLALACSIVHNPPMLFLDEATSGVDPESRRNFWELLNRFAEGGMTILVTTHFMDEAEHCNRIAFIKQGNLLGYGTPLDLKTKTGQDSMEDVFVVLAGGKNTDTLLV